MPVSALVAPQLTRSGDCVLLARNSFLGLPSRAVTYSSPGFDLDNATLSCLRVTGTFECLQPGWAMAYVALDYRYTRPWSDATCAQRCLDYGAICEGYLRDAMQGCVLLTAPFMRTTNSNNPNDQSPGQRVCLRTRSSRQLFGDAVAAPPAPPPPPPPFWLVGNLTRNATGNGTANGTAVGVGGTVAGEAGNRDPAQTCADASSHTSRAWPAFLCCCQAQPLLRLRACR